MNKAHISLVTSEICAFLKGRGIRMSRSAYRTKQDLNIEVDGATIYYKAMLRNPLFPTILFVHEAGFHTDTFQVVTDYLEGSYNWVAVDLPGHFRSSGEAKITIAENAIFIHVFVLELIKKHALLEKFIYVGHSFGGAIGIAVAVEQCPWLHKIVLVATSANFTETICSDFLAKMENNVVDLAFYQKGFSPQSPRHFFESLVARLHYVPLRTIVHDFKAMAAFNYTNKLERIQCETLIVSANDDQITPVQAGEVLHAGIKTSSWVRLEHAGHFVLMEKPRKIAAVIESFI